MSLNKRLMSSGPPAFAAGENFKAVTYTGNSGALAVTGVGFKPDWVWIHARNEANYSHFLTDSTRGGTKVLQSNSTAAEATRADNIQSFDADGFTLAGDGTSNYANTTYVAWCWKSGGGTTSSNTDGSITTTVQVNADAGFSIVTGTTPSSTADANNAGHGLGVAPDLIIMKPLVVENWYVYHSALGEGSLTRLDTTAAVQTGVDGIFSVVNSTTFRTNYTSAGDHPFVAYCFKAIDGFSSFGSYIGNGTTLIIETGFEPAFILIKGIVGNDNWRMYDTARGISAGGYLRADSNAAEDTGDAPNINILSNGFEITAGGTNVGNNANGNGYVYWAFAADPDTTAPTLASSFDIKTYSMSGGSDYDLSFNFRPQFVVTKTRDEGAHWSWNDVVRGANSSLASNDSNAVSSSHQWRVKDWFTGSTSVTIAQHASTDTANVSYAWKADDNEPTIFGGPAAAAYKFEDNANDVSGTYNGTASNVSYVTGNFNKAAEFNGSNSGINIGNIGIGGAAARTISAWVYVDNLDSAQTIFQYGANSNGQRFGWAIDTAGKIYVEFYNRDAITSSAHISANTWYHLVATYNGGAIQTAANTQIYVNGVAVAMSNSGAQTGNANTGDSNYGIGYDRLNTRQYFDGKIDQLRIYRGAIKEYQVNKLYNETASQNDDLSLGGLPEILISANSNAGFSIVKYKGSTGIQKIPHGLSAAPNMIIAKNISDNGTSWTVFHSSLGAGKILRLENAEDEITNDVFWGGTSNAPNATTFTVGVQNDTNAEDGSSNEIIAYCFHDVSGYQKFGSYTGSGSTGNTVTVGFQPDFVMVKSSDEDEPWFVLDSKRDTSNPRDNRLMFDASNAEDDGSVHTIDFNSTNFVLNGTSGNGTNGSSKSYVYWAIKIN